MKEAVRALRASPNREAAVVYALDKRMQYEERRQREIERRREEAESRRLGQTRAGRPINMKLLNGKALSIVGVKIHIEGDTEIL